MTEEIDQGISCGFPAVRESFLISAVSFWMNEWMGLRLGELGIGGADGGGMACCRFGFREDDGLNFLGLGRMILGRMI